LLEKHGEIIADNVSKAGWIWGRVSAVDSRGRSYRPASHLIISHASLIVRGNKLDGEWFEQSMYCSQGFFAGKNRTFFKRLDVLPSKLPRLVEQQWELFTICDSTHGALFVCRYIAENSLL